jgi:DUF305 family protein family protein
MRVDALLSGAFVGQFLLVCLFGTALVAVGVACGLAVARHRRIPGSPRVVFSDADLDFMTGLSAHDREAAEVAMLACRHSQDAAVRALALDVVAEQHERLGRVTGWRDLGAPDATRPLSIDTGPLRVLPDGMDGTAIVAPDMPGTRMVNVDTPDHDSDNDSDTDGLLMTCLVFLAAVVAAVAGLRPPPRRVAPFARPSPRRAAIAHVFPRGPRLVDLCISRT